MLRHDPAHALRVPAYPENVHVGLGLSLGHAGQVGQNRAVLLRCDGGLAGHEREIVQLHLPMPDEEEWQVPEKLYHGTSLQRFKNMLASPRSFELYLADSEGGTEMYATEAAYADDAENPVPVTVVFDTEKLTASGKLMPDWDDVNTMIKNGDTDAGGRPLFGDARSAEDVSWLDSLRIINTCSYEGDVSRAIVEVLMDDGETAKPPFEGLR